MATASTLQVLGAGQEPDPATTGDPPESLTLLELVHAISKKSQDDRVVVETVISLLRSGRVQLRGNCRGDSIDEFEA